MLAGASISMLTPLSTFATSRALTLAASGQPLDASLGASFSGVARNYGLPDVTTTFPSVADVAPELQARVSTLASRQMGLVLAGMAVEANALGTSHFALTNAMASDISDGSFDGKKGLAGIPMNRTSAVMLPADTGGAPFQAGVKKFHDSPGNAMKNVAAPEIFSGPIGIGVNTGGLYWISTTVLPAWRSGQLGTATIQASGGVRPYGCVLAGGQLPAGLSLSGCTIGGVAPTITNTSISAAFSLTMTDSSTPARAVTADLHITIVPEPPVVRISGGECPGPKQPCHLTGFAVAAGGTAPYYYTDGDFSFPPIGMMLWLDGSLRGIPKRAGRSSTFQVCAVDIGAAVGCTNANFTTRVPGKEKNYSQTQDGPATCSGDATGDYAAGFANILNGTTLGFVTVRDNAVETVDAVKGGFVWVPIDASGHAQLKSAAYGQTFTDDFSFTSSGGKDRVTLTRTLESMASGGRFHERCVVSFSGVAQ
jgi:hypothetical protein